MSRMSDVSFVLSLRQRWRIRRAGRLDARHRLPVPPLDGEVTTPWREGLWAERDHLVEQLRSQLQQEAVALAEGIAAEVAVIGPLEDRRVVLEEELRDLAERRRVSDGRPDADLRLTGEENTPITTVRRRRGRSYDRRTSELRSALSEVAAQLAQHEVSKAGLQVRLDRARADFASRAEQVHQETLARRALYDRALMHRHPQRYQLTDRLDMTVKDLPDWVGKRQGPEEDHRR
jgi:hypothetical protein